MNHSNSEFGCSALDDAVRAPHRHGWKKLAIGQIFQMVGIAANTDLPFNLVVIRGQVSILDRPIRASTFEAVAIEIAWAQPPSDRVPQQCFAANAAGALVFKPSDTRNHDGHPAVRELVRHSMRVESPARVDARPAFHHNDIESTARQARGERTTSRTGTYDADVKESCIHAHE